MTEYRAPQVVGRRMVLAARVLPPIHRAAHDQASRLGLSVSEYVAALIARDNHMPSKLDEDQQSVLPLDEDESTVDAGRPDVREQDQLSLGP